MDRIGIDIGGAFTDLVYIGDDGNLLSIKVDSTSDYVSGVINSLNSSKIDLRKINSIIHGQTVVINSIIQKNFPPLGLITTSGFRDILEIQRANRRDIYNLKYKKPETLIRRHFRIEVDERTDHKGKIIKEPGEQELKEISAFFHKEKIKNISVSLLNSYTNDKNEKTIGEFLKKENFDYVTLSSEITKEWREYERTSTAVLNSSVMPSVDIYITKLEEFIHKKGFIGNFFIMSSNGGINKSSYIKKYPIITIESGPIGGVIGALKLVKDTYGEDNPVNIITLDGGSTTTKTSLISGHMPKIISEYYIGRDQYNAGYPVNTPVVDIKEVGSGGTSIAYIDNGNLKVGPRAAGAYPGPACYSRGGKEPTLTDAYLINGFIDPDYFLGGDIKLSMESARSAVATLAEKINMSVEDTADGIINLANENSAFAIRLISIQRGYDPRDFILVPFGGSGPMQAAFISNNLGIKKILIPYIPLGVFSAWGMLNADLRHEQTKTIIMPITKNTINAIDDEFKILENDITKTFEAENEHNILLTRFADLRYAGQEHTLRIKMPNALIGNIDKIYNQFHAEHEKEYAFKIYGNMVEIVNINVVGIVPVKTKNASVTLSSGKAEKKIRKVYLDGQWQKIDIYAKERIPFGSKLEGPMIIEEKTSTIIVLKKQRVTTDRFGNMVIEGE
jgi:N-methylhydantoinase A